MPGGGKVSYNTYCEECLAALEWGIPLYEWFRMTRSLRISHVDTVRARNVIAYYSLKD